MRERERDRAHSRERERAQSRERERDWLMAINRFGPTKPITVVIVRHDPYVYK